MSAAPRWIVPAMIYLVIPACGLFGFLRLRGATRQYSDARALDGRLFVLCCVYGGWLLVVLSGLAGEWSGAASLGVGGLVFVAPLVTIGIAVAAFRARGRSTIHGIVFWSAALYLPLMLVSLGGAIECCGGPP